MISLSFLGSVWYIILYYGLVISYYNVTNSIWIEYLVGENIELVEDISFLFFGLRDRVGF